jgi:hypothetical protein
VWDPAMTDFRAKGTIMGLTGLTAVFGMGTGGTPSVSSPESGRGAVRPHGRGESGWIGTPVVGSCGGSWRASSVEGGLSLGFIHQRDQSRMRLIEFTTLIDEIKVGRNWSVEDRFAPPARPDPDEGRRQRVGVVKPFGC